MTRSVPLLANATLRYALWGMLFGACFPLGATWFDVWMQGLPLNWDSVLGVQRQQPLHWIIDTAPLFLGLMASLAGLRQQRIESFNRQLERRVDARTSELLLVNADLQTVLADRERTQDDLLAAVEATEAANRAKSEFLATMSHEIRTPLNGVIGMTGLLLDTALDREQAEYAATVRTSGEALLAVINDILDFSKIDAGKVQLEEVDFNVRTAVEESVDLVVHAAEEQGIELAFLVNHDVPETLRGDPGRLRQILLNLLSNAVKFTSEGEVVVFVSKVPDTGPGVTLRFEVRDTGIGISVDRFDGLFRAFAQADSSTTRKFGGTGLGLTIAQRLCALMGGEIGVASELGTGSNFWFTVVVAEQAGAQRPLQRVAMHDLVGLRILIVDDNATNRRIVAHNLQPLGWSYTEAEGGVEALQVLADAAHSGSPFDLALLDFQMPGMDGATLAREIGSRPALAGLPLILLTSMSQQGDFKRMEELGFSGYLVKPIKPSQLFDCIALVMGSTRAPGASEASLITRHVLRQDDRNSLRILLAEDNVVNQKVAVRILQNAGFRCDVAANGLEAVTAVSSVDYDLVLMDCQMPEMDGYEATRSIRARCLYGGKHIPIVAMTANAMQGDRQVCLAAGMDDYVSKPVTAEMLVDVVERWIV